jgi:hypothetical protein
MSHENVALDHGAETLNGPSNQNGMAKVQRAVDIALHASGCASGVGLAKNVTRKAAPNLRTQCFLVVSHKKIPLQS